MSYYDQAKGINEELRNLFNSIPVKQFTADQREQILNIFIRYGQVCKFRCRNNTAFDSFTQQCFKELAEVNRVQANPGDEWKTLRATYNESH